MWNYYIILLFMYVFTRNVAYLQQSENLGFPRKYKS